MSRAEVNGRRNGCVAVDGFYRCARVRMYVSGVGSDYNESIGRERVNESEIINWGQEVCLSWRIGMGMANADMNCTHREKKCTIEIFDIVNRNLV